VDAERADDSVTHVTQEKTSEGEESEIGQASRAVLSSEAAVSMSANAGGVSEHSIEQHYTPEEIAERWRVSGNTVRRTFRNEPGVLLIDRPEQLHKRGYKTMRIPASVVDRVHRKLAA
jgi:hypothetical protein